MRHTTHPSALTHPGGVQALGRGWRVRRRVAAAREAARYIDERDAGDSFDFDEEVRPRRASPLLVPHQCARIRARATTSTYHHLVWLSITSSHMSCWPLPALIIVATASLVLKHPSLSLSLNIIHTLTQAVNTQYMCSQSFVISTASALMRGILAALHGVRHSLYQDGYRL